MSETLWETVDEPMLRWIAALPPSVEYEILKLDAQDPGPFEHVDGVDSVTAHQSLLRLKSHGLIDGQDTGTTAYRLWTRLRVTARGWIVLGEWPDLDRVVTAASIHRLLRALADDAPEEERDALRRAAGLAARTADDVVRDTLAQVAHAAGEDLA